MYRIIYEKKQCGQCCHGELVTVIKLYDNNDKEPVDLICDYCESKKYEEYIQEVNPDNCNHQWVTENIPGTDEAHSYCVYCGEPS